MTRSRRWTPSAWSGAPSAASWPSQETGSPSSAPSSVGTTTTGPAASPPSTGRTRTRERPWSMRSPGMARRSFRCWRASRSVHRSPRPQSCSPRCSARISRTDRTAGSGSRGGSPMTGSSPPSTPMPATATRRTRVPSTGTRATSRSTPTPSSSPRPRSRQGVPATATVATDLLADELAAAADPDAEPLRVYGDSAYGRARSSRRSRTPGPSAGQGPAVGRHPGSLQQGRLHDRPRGAHGHLPGRLRRAVPGDPLGQG